MRQRHEAELGWPMLSVFGALIEVVAKGRWGGAAIVSGTMLPRAGCQYAAQRGKVLRRGKVLECLRPVSITLKETLLDPPCCVQLRLHWRIEPFDTGSLLLLEARYSLNGAATLRRRHWYERIHGHCSRMLAAVQRRLTESGAAGDVGPATTCAQPARGGCASSAEQLGDRRQRQET